MSPGRSVRRPQLALFQVSAGSLADGEMATTLGFCLSDFAVGLTSTSKFASMLMATRSWSLWLRWPNFLMFHPLGRNHV